MARADPDLVERKFAAGPQSAPLLAFAVRRRVAWRPADRGGSAITTNDVAKRRTPGRAIASLVLGIIGVVLVPLIPAIIAVVLGRRARDEIDANPQALDGRGMATAGIVLGWVGIALFAVGVLIGLAIGLS